MNESNRLANVRMYLFLQRNKLHIVGSELADAKHRVSELEANQIMQGKELERSAADILSISEPFHLLWRIR
jgi:hypothetical protein